MKYATAEKVLADLFGANDDARGKALRGRLKRLKTLGIPLGVNPGTGSKVWYPDDVVYQWAFCLALEEASIDPKKVVEFVRANWDRDIRPKFKDAGAAYHQQRDWIFIAYPAGVSSAWTGEPLKHEWKRLGDMARWSFRQSRPATVINVSALANQMSLLRVRADTAASGKGAK